MSTPGGVCYTATTNEGVYVLYHEASMALTDEQIQHVALLARLGLTARERDRLRAQLSTILAHIDQLNELELATIPPTAQVIPLDPVLRDDVVRPSLTVEQVLANAPRGEDGFLKVRAILEQE